MSISQVSKGPPHPHAHAVTSQTCPHPPALVLPKSWRPPDCASGRSSSALQCVGSTPPADMCTKVSGFAFRVQAWTCGWGQGCNCWRQKTAASMCTTAATEINMSKWVTTVGLNGQRAFVCFVFTSSTSTRRFRQTVLLTETLTPPPPANLSGAALIFRLHREKDCLKATPYCCRADSLHNHARTLEGPA